MIFLEPGFRSPSFEGQGMMTKILEWEAQISTGGNLKILSSIFRV